MIRFTVITSSGAVKLFDGKSMTDVVIPISDRGRITKVFTITSDICILFESKLLLCILSDSDDGYIMKDNVINSIGSQQVPIVILGDNSIYHLIYHRWEKLYDIPHGINIVDVVLYPQGLVILDDVGKVYRYDRGDSSVVEYHALGDKVIRQIGICNKTILALDTDGILWYNSGDSDDMSYHIIHDINSKLTKILSDCYSDIFMALDENNNIREISRTKIGSVLHHESKLITNSGNIIQLAYGYDQYIKCVLALDTDGNIYIYIHGKEELAILYRSDIYDPVICLQSNILPYTNNSGTKNARNGRLIGD